MNLLPFQFLQVTTAAVEQYTGEGEPPYCEMTLRAIDDNTTHHANFTVTLNGARPPKNIKILRKLEFDDVPPNPTPDSVGTYDALIVSFYEFNLRSF